MLVQDGKKIPLFRWSYCKETCDLSEPHEIVHAILSNRGLLSSEEQYHSPFMISGTNDAVERVIQAYREKESILLHGDYDVDGIVGTVILHRFLKSIGINSLIFLPTRQEHGYGLSIDAIEKSIKAKIPLIITVDCGIADHANVTFALKNSVDVIITDHHQVPAILPDIQAIVHPQLPTDSYPFPHLSGAGVAFKLILALSEKMGIAIDQNEYLPYVALSIITDIMPVIGENRRFVRDGITAIRKGYAPHIEMIAKSAGYSLNTITERELGIHVGSRLNAPGRLKTPVISAKFLLEEETAKMAKMALEIERLNSRRREIQDDLAKKALEIAIKESHLPMHILHAPEWHEGLTGTAASRVVDELGHPVILITKSENGIWKGSGRAPEGIDLYSLISSTSDLLEHYGGHEGACGFAIEGEKIGLFRKRILDEFTGRFPEGLPKPSIEISASLDYEILDDNFIEELNLIAPFGRGNPEPLFEFGPFGIENANFVGGGNHLKMSMKSKTKTHDAILFSAKGIPLGDVIGRVVKIAAIPRINEFNGKRNIEFQIKDLNPLN